MKVLLDENLPKRLKADLSMFEVGTVREKGWQGCQNGELIRAMLAEGYQALLTFDKNLQYQQNFAKYPLTVLLLNAKNNRYVTLRPLMSKVVEKLNSNPGPGVFEICPDK